MTIKELMNELAKYPPDAAVLVTWESTFHEPAVYQAKNGTVIFDANYFEFYREQIESGELEAVLGGS